MHGAAGCRATPFAGAKAPPPYSIGDRADLASIARAQRDPAAPGLSMSRARSSFICDHLAAGTAISALLAITGIMEAGSLARYARHVPGVSSSKAVLRARWLAETAR